MPAAIEYVPPTDKRRDAFNRELLTERRVRRDRYETALKYYDGKHPEQLDYDPDIDPNDNTTINLVKITAERTVSFLFPSLPKFQTDPDAIEPTPEEEWIGQFIEANGGLVSLTKLGLRGFLAGHTFVRVKPGRKRDEMPKMILLDPLAITVFWNADDVGEVLWYENRYVVGEDVYIQDYVSYPDEGEAGEWRIYTYKTKQVDTETLLGGANSPHGAGPMPRVHLIDYVDAQVMEPVPTPEGRPYGLHTSPIPPIIEFGHLPHPDDRYGHGEVTQTDLQDTVNRVWSEINRIVRKHSDPVDVITGADVDDVESGDDIMTVASTDAKVQRLEMKGDLQAALSTVEKLVETYLAVARVVLLKGEAKDLQRVTNASVRTLFIDALAKNEILRHAYGNGLVQIVKLALLMSGKFTASAKDLRIALKWPEALPTDKLEIAQINQLMTQMKAQSRRTSATDMGKDWAFEQAAMEAEVELDMQHQEAQMQLQQKFAPEPAEPPDKPA